MGVGATDTPGRMLAAIRGLGPVNSRFEWCADVPKAGVLLALPALLCCGLLAKSPAQFQLPQGYYGLSHIFLLVAFMARARIKTVEGLRYCAPGEWGKVLGLDRIPEARTLRAKLQWLGDEQRVAQWASDLCLDWMQSDPDSAGTLYVDGHVRVYHGAKAHLPKHYVARERLCLRATTDYWVNAAGGRPFFVVHRPVDSGLLAVLEGEIVPRLEKEVPHQPTPEQLAQDPTLDNEQPHGNPRDSPAGRLRASDQRHLHQRTAGNHGGGRKHVREMVAGNISEIHAGTLRSGPSA